MICSLIGWVGSSKTVKGSKQQGRELGGAPAEAGEAPVSASPSEHFQAPSSSVTCTWDFSGMVLYPVFMRSCAAVARQDCHNQYQSLTC